MFFFLSGLSVIWDSSVLRLVIEKLWFFSHVSWTFLSLFLLDLPFFVLVMFFGLGALSGEVEGGLFSSTFFLEAALDCDLEATRDADLDWALEVLGAGQLVFSIRLANSFVE